jgi:NAD(P)-dependent dehydrogenase (short-subunit alcohol dehydrogenase family)
MSKFMERKVAVLNATGAIAQAIVRGFAAEGAHVAAIDSADEFARHSETLKGPDPGRVQKVVFDADASALLDSCERALGGPVEVLVCAAPPVGQVTVLDMSADELRRTVEAELCVPALLMQEAGRRMAQNKSGRIISLFSMSAKTGVHTKVGPFAAAKGGLLAFSRVMAAELAPMGVTVNGIATSLFEPQVEILEREEREALSKAIPVRRFGRVTEAAHAALFLASEEAAFITGETMNLSGGRFMD